MSYYRKLSNQTVAYSLFLGFAACAVMSALVQSHRLRILGVLVACVWPTTLVLAQFQTLRDWISARQVLPLPRRTIYIAVEKGSLGPGTKGKIIYFYEVGESGASHMIGMPSSVFSGRCRLFGYMFRTQPMFLTYVQQRTSSTSRRLGS